MPGSEGWEDLAKSFLKAADPLEAVKDMDFVPDPWQEQLFQSRSRYIIEACARQVGKSTSTGMLAYLHAKQHPNTLTLLISRAYRQSLLLFEKVIEARDRDKTWKGHVKRATMTEMAFLNGSKIVAAPGKSETIRGFSGVDLLIVDEAAYVPDELFAAIFPMIAVSGGRVILLSSPRARSGTFFEIWQNGGSGWQRFKVTAYDCPRADLEFLEKERLRLPEYIYRREYLAEFTASSDALVSEEDISAAFTDDLQTLISDDSMIDDIPMMVIR